ncbi:MAG: hypothetical protein RIM84_06630 [Alphaproteobacteria bacterium]
MRFVVAAIAMGVALSTAGAALANDKVALRLPGADTVEGLSRSIATPLLKTKTQFRILKHDDELASNCDEKSFASAKIITSPIEVSAGKKKWQEQWVLDRCGTAVGYRIFFTDVGDGGAYFAFRQTN